MSRLTTCLAAFFFMTTVGCADASGDRKPLSRDDHNVTADDDDESSDDDDAEDDSDSNYDDGDGDDDDSSSSDDDSDTTDWGDGDGDQNSSPGTAKDAGAGGFDLSDLFPPSQPSDAGTSSGPRDVNGPCKDLQLFCFDPFDMFIINPSDCFTCNGGKGCQGCAFPYAY